MRFLESICVSVLKKAPPPPVVLNQNPERAPFFSSQFRAFRFLRLGFKFEDFRNLCQALAEILLYQVALITCIQLNQQVLTP